MTVGERPDLLLSTYPLSTIPAMTAVTKGKEAFYAPTHVRPGLAAPQNR